MTASGSDRDPAPAPFVEDDRAETPLPMGDGGTPAYVTAVWIGLLVLYAVYFAVLGLPDLLLWGVP